MIRKTKTKIVKNYKKRQKKTLVMIKNTKKMKTKVKKSIIKKKKAKKITKNRKKTQKKTQTKTLHSNASSTLLPSELQS